ncbi:MAG: double-strand break repair protein AddB [Alphaproteobacteria bacterium]|nr:double-strand break repair protein AddB [Alphaproteobacteria bacterium]
MPLPPPGLYSIPAHRPFVDDLARVLLDEASTQSDPLTLSRVTVLLPTRRACRALQESFLRLSEGAALVLPRLVPIGDVDEDELSVSADTDPAALASRDVPPAMPELRRRLLLADELRSRYAELGESLPVDQAVELAGALARLLDQVQTERLDFSALEELVPEDYAEHWQDTLSFFYILCETWPGPLERAGATDSAERRNLLLEARVAAWQKNPPRQPVIAAGSTGSIPATADLLACVASLPSGYVLMPGLDRTLDDRAWSSLEASHPQYGLRQLLERMGEERAAVGEWPAGETGGMPDGPARTRLIAEALRPAATTDTWREERGTIPATALDGVVRIDARHPHEEAGAIALVLREVLETPGRTAALVTPDRDVARRTAALLGRWGVVIDDSAGVPLSDTPPGAFLRGVLEMVHDEFAPVPLLAALKHPIAAGGMTTGSFRRAVRMLERAVLRGPRPLPGVTGLRSAVIRAVQDREDGDDIDWNAVQALVDKLAQAAGGLENALHSRDMPLGALVEAHAQCAEALAATDEQSGAERLWHGDDGEALAGFISELVSHGQTTRIAPGRYARLFDALMAGRVVRPRFGTHPRLSILGPLEARLQRQDVMVLAGLNEGTWPAEADVDPWMSRPMRAAFGLPSPERRTGLSAHDFTQAFCAETVVLTRSERVDGAPAIPSRWLTRLDVAVEALGVEGGDRVKARGDTYLNWWRSLESPAPPDPRTAQSIRPRPRPPLESRPRELSVTQIETWMRDPYAIYARMILDLEALAPIDQAVDAADYGSLIHRIFDRFLGNYPEGPLPADAGSALRSIGEEVLGPYRSLPAVWSFWWPRFERMAAWFLETEVQRRTILRRTHAEVRGRLELDAPGGIFVLRARADRIDELADGGLAVIDFKTGAPPTKKEVAAGFAPQLPLEAAILAHGRFDGVPGGEAGELAYWRLSGGRDPGEIRDAADDPSEVALQAFAGLRELVTRFDDPRTPYESRPRPDRAPKYSDYEHLARVKEWSVTDDGEGDE